MSATLNPGSARFPSRAWHAATVARGPLAVLLDWHRRNREREQLQGLSDHTLRDLGLSRPEVDGPLRLMAQRD